MTKHIIQILTDEYYALYNLASFQQKLQPMLQEPLQKANAKISHNSIGEILALVKN